MPVKHIVLWTLKDAAEGKSAQENAREIKSRLEALAGRVPGLIKLEVGVDFSRTGSSADVALYSEFVDREALAAYAIHPEHVAAAGFANLVRDTRIIADYEVS